MIDDDDGMRRQFGDPELRLRIAPHIERTTDGRAWVGFAGHCEALGPINWGRPIGWPEGFSAERIQAIGLYQLATIAGNLAAELSGRADRLCGPLAPGAEAAQDS